MHQAAAHSSKIVCFQEYFFDNPISRPSNRPITHHSAQSNDIRQLTEEEFHHVDSQIASISAQYPDIVIKVPISWEKPINRPANESEYLRSKSALDPRSHLHNYYRSRWQNKNHTNSRAEKARNAAELGIEKFGQRYSHDFPDIKSDTTHLARNTTLTYFGGSRINKYHKIMGFQEVLGVRPGENVQFFSGEDYGGAHILPDGMHATQETCRDHAVNTAGYAGEIHFVHSDGVRPTFNAQKYQDTSLIVHVNTRKAAPSAGFFGDGPSMQKIDLVDRSNMSANEQQPISVSHNLELYKVEI
jgi:hypothetical protein